MTRGYLTARVVMSIITELTCTHLSSRPGHEEEEEEEEEEVFLITAAHYSMAGLADRGQKTHRSHTVLQRKARNAARGSINYNQGKNDT